MSNSFPTCIAETFLFTRRRIQCTILVRGFAPLKCMGGLELPGNAVRPWAAPVSARSALCPLRPLRSPRALLAQQLRQICAARLCLRAVALRRRPNPFDVETGGDTETKAVDSTACPASRWARTSPARSGRPAHDQDQDRRLSSARIGR